MSHTGCLMARLRARLYRCCVSRTHMSTFGQMAMVPVHVPTSCHVTKRPLHSSTPHLIRGWQRKQFTKEMNDSVGSDLVERRKDRGTMKFEKIPIGPQEEVESSEERELEHSSERFVKDSHLAPATAADIMENAENITDTGFVDSIVIESIPEELSSEESPHEGNVPVNIMGDLESMFAEQPQQSEEVVTEQEGVVETVTDVDYRVYYTSREGDRFAVPEQPLSRWNLGTNIPLDHIVRFLRDLKCFDNEIIEAKECSIIKQVIVTSVHNRRHLKDAARTFFKMCRDDYNMSMVSNEKTHAGYSWIVYDLGHSYIHFFLPLERARVNIESFCLGQDVGIEENEYSEEDYNADLLQGLFPDEDFSKLGKPFELVHDQKEKGK